MKLQQITQLPITKGDVSGLRFKTICVAQFWNKSILLTRDSIISEIVFYKQYWMKDAIRQLEALLCNFQDLLIY